GVDCRQLERGGKATNRCGMLRWNRTSLSRTRRENAVALRLHRRDNGSKAFLPVSPGDRKHMPFKWPKIGELGMKVRYYLRIAKAITAASSTALDYFGGCRAQQDIVKWQV